MNEAQDNYQLNNLQFPFPIKHITDLFQYSSSLHDVLEYLSFCYLLVDPVTLKIEYSSPSAQKLYQYSEEEFSQLPFYSLFDWPWEKVSRFFTEEKYHRTKRLNANQLRKDETQFYSELFLGPCKVDNKETYFVFIRDLTETKIKENRLIEKEKRYRTLFLNMNSPFSFQQLRFDDNKQIENCIIIETNLEFEKMVAMQEISIIGKPFQQIISAVDHLNTPWKEYLKRIMLDKEEISFEISFGIPQKNYLVIAYPINDSQFATIFEDITSQKHLDRLRNSFINTLTHEIRTPLTAIKAGIEIWVKNPEAPLVKQENLPNMIHNNVLRIINLINDVLDYQKIDNQPFHEFFTQQSINKLILEIVAKIQKMVDEKNIELRLNLDDSIQKSWFYKEKIMQVCINLINNAIKYTNYGQIVIATSLKRNMTQVMVADTGIGIETDAQKKLFDTFYQVNPSHKDGTGLGLAICRKIIERHGGNIWVESKPFQGSSFYFTIPYDIKEKEINP